MKATTVQVDRLEYVKGRRSMESSEEGQVDYRHHQDMRGDNYL
jgi:hypothetical protein